jgi:hypothetical protein
MGGARALLCRKLLEAHEAREQRSDTKQNNGGGTLNHTRKGVVVNVWEMESHGSRSKYFIHLLIRVLEFIAQLFEKQPTCAPHTPPSIFFPCVLFSHQQETPRGVVCDFVQQGKMREIMNIILGR